MEVLTIKTKAHLADGIVGGIIGGIAMALVAMIGSLVLGQGLLQPVVLVGYAFQPHTADPVGSTAIMLKGMVILLTVAVVAGFIFVGAVNLFLNGKSLMLWGMAYAAFIWLILVFGGFQVFDATMAAHMNQAVFFLAHITYGIVLGAYVARRTHHFQAKV